MILSNLVAVIIGLIGLVLGGNWLVRGSSRLAASLQISPLIIGITIVAFGTSVPELLVSINASLNGSSAIAVGNVVGSNIANIGLILGLAGILINIPIHFDLIKREIPVLILSSIAVWFMSSDGVIGRLDGLILLTGFILFNIVLIRAAKRERLRDSEVNELVSEEGIQSPINRLVEIGWFIGGLIALLIGSSQLVTGAVAIARDLGVSELIIGITLVSIGTSLPELITSVIASYRREQDILFGNVIGSNIFNVLAIIGITAFVRPIPISQRVIEADFPLMIIFALVLVIFGIRGQLPRWASALLLVGYGTFVTYTVLNG